MKETTVHHVEVSSGDFQNVPHTMSQILLELMADMSKELMTSYGLPLPYVTEAQIRVSFRVSFDPWTITAIGTVEKDK